MEVSAHIGARPDHAEWQGRWYSLSGKSEKYPSLVEVTGYGTGEGLKGWNCRHDFYPVIPGISEPSYTEEELKSIDPPPFEYNGRTYTCYEATQRQRYMERAMRKTKREILAADSTGDKDRFTEKSVLFRRQREEYNKFSKTSGLLTQNERTQVNGFGRSQASRASWAAKKAQTASGGSAVSGGSNGGNAQNYRYSGLTNGGGSGTIKSSGKENSPSTNHSYEYVTKIEHLTPSAINATLSEFEDKYRTSSIEHCRVITTSGEIYDVHGDKFTVNTTILGDKMIGSINEHNHVFGESQYSFSWEDLKSYIEEKSSIGIACDEKFRYIISDYNHVALDETYYEAKDKAIENVYNRRIAGENIPDEDVQHEMIKDICKSLNIKYKRYSI